MDKGSGMEECGKKQIKQKKTAICAGGIHINGIFAKSVSGKTAEAESLSCPEINEK